MLEKRELWHTETVSDIPAENIIFMDETWANTKMSPSYGWAPSHLRAYGVVPHGHYVQVTMVAAVCRSGVFADHSFVGSMNGSRFYEWVAEHLVPHLTKGDVLIMDNLSSHKNKAAIVHMDVFFGVMKNTPSSIQQYRIDTAVCWCSCVVSSAVFA